MLERPPAAAVVEQRGAARRRKQDQRRENEGLRIYRLVISDHVMEDVLNASIAYGRLRGASTAT
jgi:hypothetical protein